MGFAAVGVLAGLAIAFVAAPWVEPLLFMESPRDAVVYGGVAVIMAVAALLASLPPALKALHADPIAALRSD
jgi:ABC-type antimicrobial peptide transport system permease subunit